MTKAMMGGRGDHHRISETLRLVRERKMSAAVVTVAAVGGPAFRLKPDLGGGGRERSGPIMVMLLWSHSRPGWRASDARPRPMA